MTLLLAEIPVRRPGAAADEILRLASADYNHPSAPGFYRGVIQRDGDSALVPMYTRTAMSGGESFGAAKLAVASLPVMNTGRFDWLIAEGVAIEGRAGARLLLGADAAAPYSSFVPVLTGQVATVEPSRTNLSFTLRDPLAFLDDPLTESDFAGSNIAPEGVEGTEADLKGKRKPVAYGLVKDAPAIAVNIPKHVYQVADRAVSVTAVYDKGNALGVGLNRGSLALLLSTDPEAGKFDWYGGAEGTFFRIGFPATGAVSADLAEGANAAARTVGQVWQRLLTGRCGIAAADVNAADVAALDAAAPGGIGFWAGLDGMTRRDALDAIAESLGAVYWVTAAGQWRIAQFAEPAGEPVLTLRDGGALALGEADIVDLQPAPWPLPAYEMKLSWGRCWSPLDRNSMAATVYEDQPERLAFLSQEWRTATEKDEGVKTLYPTGRSLEFRSLLVEKTAAEAEGTRRFGLVKGRRRAWRVSCVTSPDRVAAVDLMSVIRLYHRRFGLTGKRYRVLDVAGDRASGHLDLMVWG
ncbi:hypothetical protein VZ95_11200 [Elstera litoralis]|uniref:Tip attachment protein J domain-containing protein n=1 Tax=Elstera litoralis TaxID=552518 RepID=A0A0F3IRU8_9PROT|nr:hypothetical protein [Elstera litoralis]KJV09475.1 hypothetical protein VZ95_11200 [Elstera litoralis]